MPVFYLGEEIMAKKSNQKLKILYLAKILNENTNDDNGITMPQIIEKLESYGISADRKTIYMDIEELRNYGMDILSEKRGSHYYYFVGSRLFELAELKLLVDSVQSAKFITEKKSKELIKKLGELASKQDASQLNRQVYIAGRVKTMNESIYYNVDKIHHAINIGHTIRFRYFQWNIRKEAEPRHGGAWYSISPLNLIWDDEYYYLVGYDSQNDDIRHFRVDKMTDICVTDEPCKKGGPAEGYDVASYSKKLFGMFGGKTYKVEFECEDSMAGIMIDRFGKDIAIIKKDDSHFKTVIDVALSEQFMGWLFSLGNRIRIVSPPEVKEKVKEQLEALHKLYE